MHAKPVFGIEDTHRILHRFDADIRGSSEGLGWSSAFASVQRERPYDGKLHALSDSLMVLHRGGPVDITYTVEGRSIVRHIPRGGVFFLPAGQECDVLLHDALESTHIYLRSDLFADPELPRSLIGGLAPMLGEKDAVLEHLAAAVGDTITGNLPGSSLFVDPIARAIANRFIAINYHQRPAGTGKSPQTLSARQMQRVRDYVEANLSDDIRLDALAGLCGRSTEYFVRLFKAATGVSPYQYVLNLRIERAKALLADERHSIADVALQCGFSHQEHLTRMFRRFTGVTPGRYRRSH
ncbi:helix-turn-helix transcriptional regulator [Bradyrhizobium sp. U87765 SZCCT0131]|uniref:helix-turn-helix domain-containing protein n=1 Tax=unclassified Bradyrhizobium TaxID=2631580 RepID=UPI001BA74387|nr:MULTISPECIES: AraC family transcriptional regulator [unclassified Bradyrhizobium]MBR1218993.1 helix-turn-helix transcriptional regulator [Bradyrhizobium sp. U87765 SZCCT0131]MBR1261644.1 helix-turn-helix transcriptional regulator [Bradyrhizobium sp. U87765 SZCCT0134]MBR1306503.1 helix-turn-helix transcriptional regulator [Bradyrhizobium sp. U87765 SZCCT0110]MBR1317426.1 helix-turn-helix transcriptional regulator [Bradyrhizobium sp. U87765 SZCCT0109]MBR1351128.1 helix-turn-helix transcriptio